MYAQDNNSLPVWSYNLSLTNLLISPSILNHSRWELYQFLLIPTVETQDTMTTATVILELHNDTYDVLQECSEGLPLTLPSLAFHDQCAPLNSFLEGNKVKILRASSSRDKN